jgi:hypothetical protein
MKLQPVESSMLVAAGYDPQTRTLEVIFKEGGRYRYREVPQSEYEALLQAQSKGRYMQSYIIGHFPYEKL